MNNSSTMSDMGIQLKSDIASMQSSLIGGYRYQNDYAFASHLWPILPLSSQPMAPTSSLTRLEHWPGFFGNGAEWQAYLLPRTRSYKPYKPACHIIRPMLLTTPMPNSLPF